MVVDASSDGTASLVKAHFPYARLLEYPCGTSIETLRYHGLMHATGDIVALTEQHAMPASDWLEQIRRAVEAGAEAGGGGVAQYGGASLQGWALYFARYYRFLPPLPRQSFTDFSALNAFYRRSLLDRYLKEMQGCFAETFFHALLRTNGHILTAVPGAVVTNLQESPFGEFALNRYRSGRFFGSQLATRAGRFRRAAGVALSALLPAIFWLRCAAAVMTRRSYVGAFLLSTPLLLCYFVCWAWGEALGCASGRT